MQDKATLESIFREAVAAVEPAALVRAVLLPGREGLGLSVDGAVSVLPWPSIGRVLLAGGGKAGRAMGEAAFRALQGKVDAGVVAVPPGEGGALGPVRLVEAGHPIPDAGSREAAREMLELLGTAGEGDLVIALVSGGGSSMISAPPEGVSVADKEAAIRVLLDSGAGIADINTIRKHLSRVKGGRMARAAFPARVWALVLSDVPGDDPSVVASGPFSPDPSTYADAMRVLIGRKLCRAIPDRARRHIEAGVAGIFPDTPKSGDPSFRRVSLSVVGSNRTALDAAAGAAGKTGRCAVRTLPGFLRGEARECARTFVSELKKAAESAPAGGGVVLVAGGETTVRVNGDGKGGRNQEFALSAALEIDGEPGMAVLSCGTDGVDGPTDAAGAFADGSTCRRGSENGLSARAHLERNDSFPFFAALGDLVVTGPTGTNVADIVVGAAMPRRGGAP